MPRRGLPDLIALAYESACDPAQLEGFVEAAARYFSADRAAFAVWPRRSPGNLLALTHRLPAAEIQEWLIEGAEPGTLFARLQTEEPLTTFDAGPPRSADPGQPAGAVLAVVIDSDANNVCALILIRDAAGRFSQADHDSLEELAGYTQRAIRINQRFVRLFADHRATRRLLDSAPRGILLLGQRGQATYMNDEARRICQSDDSISLDGDQLRLADDAAMAEMEDFLAEARARSSNGQPPPNTGLRIRRASDAPPYQLIAYGMACDPRQAALDEHESLAVVMVHDPQVAPVPDEPLLKTYFDLTPAESQLVQALCAGQSLPVAAREASISVNTARTHLRSVFQKVGVHSQAALVQRVSQSLHFASPLD
ncbi:MAG: helix-turn-helix transcriptional regulator [Chromatiales bacterium]|nr:MAG: helix-turn-helix transcriptional regulator [Chromatiales bacterium]